MLPIRPPEIEKPGDLSSALEKLREGRGREAQIELNTLLKGRSDALYNHVITHSEHLVKEARKLKDCGCLLIFRDYHRISLYLLQKGFFCKQHLLCPGCGIRRSSAVTRAYRQAVAFLLESNPGWMPLLITKTVVNKPDLAAVFEHISGAHKRLMHNRRDALRADVIRLQTTTVLADIHGAAGSYEFKRGDNSGLWHPHTHEIALTDRDRWELIPEIRPKRKGGSKTVLVPVELRERLQQEWKALTGDSWIVDVCVIEHADPLNLKDGVAEAFKYALKFLELEFADQIEAYEALKTRRLIYSYGCLRGVDIPEDYKDEVDIDLTDEPYIEEHLIWQANQYNVLKRVEQQEEYCPDQPQKGKGKAAPRRKQQTAITIDEIRAWIESQQGSGSPF